MTIPDTNGLAPRKGGRGGIVRAPRRKESFEIVPHARLRDCRLSFRARGLLERLLSNTDGFSMTAHDLARESPNEGRYVILKALRELREARYLITITERGAGGRFYKTNTIYDVPQPSGGEADATEVQSPNFGDRISVAAPLEKYQEGKTKKQQHARTRAPEKAAAAVDSDSMKRGAMVHGVTVWDEDDREAVTELISKYGEAAVERAATTVSAAGQKPLPTAVAAALLPKPQRQSPADAGGEALAAIKARELARPESPTAVGTAELAKIANTFGVRRGVAPDHDGKEQGDAP